MADPRNLLDARLRAAVSTAFGPDFADVDPMVRRSERADYQADLAMGLAKPLKRAPRQVAEAVVGKLDDVFVADGFRGKGIGESMLRALEEQLKKEKVKRIDTAVVTDNEGAARFYARMGYRELGEERLAKVL